MLESAVYVPISVIVQRFTYLLTNQSTLCYTDLVSRLTVIATGSTVKLVLHRNYYSVIFS